MDEIRHIWARFAEPKDLGAGVEIEICYKDALGIDHEIPVTSEQARHLAYVLLFLASDAETANGWIQTLRSMKFDEIDVLEIATRAVSATMSAREEAIRR